MLAVVPGQTPGDVRALEQAENDEADAGKMLETQQRFFANRPWPRDTPKLSARNQVFVPSATPPTHAAFAASEPASTHSCAIRFVARTIQNSSTPRLPSTRAKPVIKAECG